MSQAPYWWPDPDTPDGLPYVRRDGERNPEINRGTDHDDLGEMTARSRRSLWPIRHRPRRVRARTRRDCCARGFSIRRRG